jgi:hypothetical protein
VRFLRRRQGLPGRELRDEPGSVRLLRVAVG